MTIQKSELARIGLAALIARLLLFAALASWLHFTPDRIARMRDGYHYLDYAQGIAAGNFESIDAFHRRLFPGYPALIAALHLTGLPIGIAALMLNWIASAVTAPLCAVLFRDRRVGWAMALLTPSHILYTTLAMSEATMLLMITIGLVLAMRERPAWQAGLFHGFAMLIRPFAFSASIGCAASRKPRDLIPFALGAGAVVVAALCVMRVWSGSIAPGYQIYASSPRAYGGGKVFTWPFHSLIVTPLQIAVAPWKIAYVWMHVAVVLLGCVLALREADETFRPLCAWWLIVNTAVVLCIGSKWGFQEFHRFTLPALPPLLYTCRRWLPEKYWQWTAIGVMSIALAFWGASSGK